MAYHGHESDDLVSRRRPLRIIERMQSRASERAAARRALELCCELKDVARRYYWDEVVRLVCDIEFALPDPEDIDISNE